MLCVNWFSSLRKCDVVLVLVVIGLRLVESFFVGVDGGVLKLNVKFESFCMMVVFGIVFLVLLVFVGSLFWIGLICMLKILNCSRLLVMIFLCSILM